ncbi:hypothetical protein F5X68DRAFT_48912 [Plectosphaerella plurivora]|uniref:J domain-containing protein n=1 Tax=Plectosphaerella plurivora TaxID=936078 RepID=A0A9P9AGW8_9PEZI|nr:hypothetical protein F5X68DRAFT_48912 [Plectosphaerella plurivora]
MSTKDVHELVTRANQYAQNVDLYALVGLEGDPSLHTDPKLIHRAWRKSSLKHHPDKTGDAFDKEKWELFEFARDILLEPAARAAYDNARAAQRLRAAERDKVQGEQRRFVDQLEADELAARRRREEKLEKDRQLELEKARLREEGVRRRAEEDERFRRENLERAELARKQEDDEFDERERELQSLLEESRARKAARKETKKAKKEGREPVVESAPPPPPPATEGTTTRPVAAAPDKGMTRPPPRWEDLKARMFAVQKRRDALKQAGML